MQKNSSKKEYTVIPRIWILFFCQVNNFFFYFFFLFINSFFFLHFLFLFILFIFFFTFFYFFFLFYFFFFRNKLIENVFGKREKGEIAPLANPSEINPLNGRNILMECVRAQEIAIFETIHKICPLSINSVDNAKNNFFFFY